VLFPPGAIGQTAVLQKAERLAVHVTDSIHPNLSAYVVVTDHPYAANPHFSHHGLSVVVLGRLRRFLCRQVPQSIPSSVWGGVFVVGERLSEWILASFGGSARTASAGSA
jgi:hypothetical protein